MSKKKAIKITTATAIAASAFVAVAPTQSEAATSSVDKAITKATNQMAKAYDTYHKTAKNEGKLPATGTIRNQVALAKDYYAAAEKEIAKNGGSKTKKAAYTKTLNAKKYFLDRAEAYLAAINTNLNPAKTAFKTAVETGKAKNVVAAKKVLVKDVETFEATVAKIYGPDVRGLLLEKYATPATDLSNSVNDELKVYDAYKKIEAGKFADLEETAKNIDSVKAEVEILKGKDTKLAKTLVEVVAKNIKAFEEAQVPTVKEVSAINGTQVVVEFNKDVTEINPANLEVTRTDDKSRAYVSQVTVDANNKKKVTVTFTSKLADDKTYSLVANGVKTAQGEVKESSKEFTYVKSVVTKVELSSTEIAATGNLKDVVKVTDQLGRNITKEVALDIQSSNTGVIDATGAAKGTGTAIVNVKVTGTTVQSGNVVITVNSAKQTTLVGFHLADTKDTPATTELFSKVKAEDVVTTLEKGSSTDINLYYNDQFGKSMNVVNGGTATYTSLNPTVVAVDASGKVTAVSTGVGAVKVKVGEFETTINITVKAASVLDELKVDKSSVNAAIGAVAPTFEISFEDQYNKEAGFDAKYLTVSSADKTVADVEKIETTNTKGTVTVKAVKEGTTTFTVKYDNGTTKLEKVVAVTVSKAGTINSYAVSSDFTKLDTDAATTKAEDDAKVANVKVSEKDAAGNVLKTIAAGETKLTFSTSTPDAIKSLLVIDDSKDTVALSGTDVTGTFTATVDVTVGSLVVGSITYTISDSSLKATKASFTKTAFDGLTVGDNVVGEFIKNVKFVDQNNSDIAVDAKNVTVEYVLSNQVNGFALKQDGTLDALTDKTKIGSADVVVTGVKVNGGANLLASAVVVKAETSKDVAALETTKAAAKTKIEAAEINVTASKTKADNAVKTAEAAKVEADKGTDDAAKEAAQKAVEAAKNLQTNVVTEVEKVTAAKAAYVGKTTVADVEAQVKIAEDAAKAAAELVK